MQQEDRRVFLSTGFPVEDVEAVHLDGAVDDGRRGSHDGFGILGNGFATQRGTGEGHKHQPSGRTGDQYRLSGGSGSCAGHDRFLSVVVSGHGVRATGK